MEGPNIWRHKEKEGVLKEKVLLLMLPQSEEAHDPPDSLVPPALLVV